MVRSAARRAANSQQPFPSAARGGPPTADGDTEVAIEMMHTRFMEEDRGETTPTRNNPTRTHRLQYSGEGCRPPHGLQRGKLS
jgi:hypothetical protein